MEKIRRTLDFPADLDNQVRELAVARGWTMLEAWRRAGELLVLAHEWKRDGYRVGATKDKKNLTSEFVGL